MTPDQIVADDDDSDRQRSTFDRADNTARLALELAEAKREIARLHRDALAEAQAYRAMFARAQEAEAKVDRLRSSKHCGCAWCCASTKPLNRGEGHKICGGE